MTIDQTQREAPDLPFLRFLRASHRTRGEQIVGFGIYLLICLSVALLNGRILQKAIGCDWYLNLTQLPWPIASTAHGFLWLGYFVSIALSAWTLWRRCSLRILKLEMSLFTVQFFLLVGWALSFFLLHQTQIALAALLILLMSHILSALLFWKKEPLSGKLLLFPFLWIFYLIGLNMAICVANS